MNTKTTIILFGALVGVLLLFGLTQALKLRKPGELATYVLPDFHDKKLGATSKDIDTVEITRAKPSAETLVFAKGDDGWRMVKPHRLRVNSAMVEQVVSQVTGAQSEKVDLATNLGEYGLDEPSVTVTLKKGVDREWKLHVGKEMPGTSTGMAYVTSSQRKQPLAVKRGQLDAVFKSLKDFRSKELLNASALNTENIQVKVGEGDPLSLVRNKEGKWVYEKPAYGEADYEGEPTPPTGDEKKITGVRDLIEAVGAIRVETDADFVEPAASEEDLAKKYGLDKEKPERLRVELKFSPGSLLGKDDKKPLATDALLIGKRVEEKDAKVDRYFARLASENAVVRVTAKSFEPLVRVAGAPEMLRNRDLVQLDAIRTDAVDVKNAAGTLKLRKAGPLDGWKVFAGGAGRTADRMAVQNLLNDLTRKRQVKSFPSEKRESELGFDRPTAEVSLWVDGLKTDEKKDDKKEEKKEEKKEDKKDGDEPKLRTEKPNVRLVFGKKEDNLLYVKRFVGDEKPLLLAVEATPQLLEKLNDGSLAYLDRILPALPPEETITKLVLLREGETYELERKDDKSGPPTWIVQQPPTFKGRTADSRKLAQLLTSLHNLNADKFLAEKPADAELEGKFGLKSPAYRITLTTKEGDKTTEHVFLFGKESDDKQMRFAKLGAGDLVFQVRQQALEPLKGELLDTTVFQFDVSKVRVLKLTGWHNLDPDIPPLEVERKDGQWTAKNRTNFPLDGGKVDSLLLGLANLRAVKFLPGAAKPEHKLTLKEGALEIAVTFEGDKESSYTLVVGPVHAADKGHYATTNKLANTVLLLGEELFKGPLAGTSYFRK